MTYSHIVVARAWADRALEFSWLAAIVLVPLITVPDSAFVATIGPPKTAALRIIASVAVVAWLMHGMLWLTARTLFPVLQPEPGAGENQSLVDRTKPYLAQPHSWVMLSVVALAAVTLLSTVLSIDRSVSTWGKLAGSEGYGLYSTAALLVLFFTVATKLRSQAQLWRLVNVLAVVGIVLALIGVAQSINLWPEQNNIYRNRIGGHSGNPIAYGGLVLLLYPVTVAAVMRLTLRDQSRWRQWLPVFAVSFLMMYAVALTLSRGPYVGMAVAIVAMLVLVAWSTGLRVGLRFTGVTLLSAAIVGVLITSPQAFSVSQPVTTTDEVGTAGLEGARAPGSEIGDRLATQGTITRRFQIWDASQELVLDRPPVPAAESNGNLFVRHLFGYGPDQFRYVFGLTADGNTFYSTVSEAHNDFVHRLVETGWLGLLTFVTALVGAAVTLFIFVFRSRRSGDIGAALLASGIIAAFIGRFAELQVGIARNSDLVIFWVLLAVVVVIPRVLASNSDRAEPSKTSAPIRSMRPLLPKPAPAFGYVFAMTTAVVLIGTVSMIAWQKNVNYVRADHQIQLARNTFAEDPRQALEHLHTATRLAPDVASYWTELGDFYAAFADVSTSSAQRMAFLEAGYDADVTALEINPLERSSNFHVAESAWNLAVEGDSAKAAVAVTRYRYLTEIAPEYRLVQSRFEEISEATRSLPGLDN